MWFQAIWASAKKLLQKLSATSDAQQAQAKKDAESIKANLDRAREADATYSIDSKPRSPK
jgi:hypothetical protein